MEGKDFAKSLALPAVLCYILAYVRIFKIVKLLGQLGGSVS